MKNLAGWATSGMTPAAGVLSVLALVASPNAMAGTNATVFWSQTSAASGIPLLGFWSLLTLGVLLAVVGLRLLKASPGTGRMLAVFFCVGAIAAVVQSTHTIAGGQFIIGVTGGDCAGGSRMYNAESVQDVLENNCPDDIVIIDYDIETRCTIVPSCPIGTVIPPGNSCQLNSVACGSAR
ncbi:MAG: hypothetical protein AAGI11_06490 [Pseudomonadota bacterium]